MSRRHSRRSGHSLKRRYGRASAGAGHIEVGLNKAGRQGWVVELKGVSSGGVLFVRPDRGKAISDAKAEAAKRGVPFVMGV